MLATLCEVLGIEPVKVQHSFSAESDVMKRQFIKQCHGKPDLTPLANHFIFRDISDSAASVAYDERTERSVLVPHTFIDATGWPCVSKSRLNPQRKANARCIQERSGVTGSVFGLYMESLKRRKVPLALGENVVGILDGCTSRDASSSASDGNGMSSMASILDQYDAAGYTAKAVLMNPFKAGWPQRRTRLYFVAVHREALGELFRWDAAVVAKNCKALVDKMAALAHKLEGVAADIAWPSLDDLLLENDDCMVAKMLTRAPRAPDAKKRKVDECGGAKWKALHDEMFSALRLTRIGLTDRVADRWLDSMIGNAHFFVLPERCQDIIRYLDFTKPLSKTSTEEEVIDVSLGRACLSLSQLQ